MLSVATLHPCSPRELKREREVVGPGHAAVHQDPTSQGKTNL